MSIETWDEIRTAYHVARMGTVSGAADVLGVHHATVIRHIDALEKRLGVRLFQRHARGYTPTEAGRDLLQVAQATADQFTQLASRIKGRGEAVTGELVVTSVAGLAGLLTPVFVAFQAAYPGVTVRFLTDVRLFRLEYGEAHVAIRAGAVPEEPDNVVQPLMRLQTGMYAARSYAAAHGVPVDEAGFAGHRFVGDDSDAARAPYHRWLRDRVVPGQFSYRASDPGAMLAAVRAGAGIGFLTDFDAAGSDDLIQVLPPRPEWEAPLWLVTHVDLHRTAKVQAFLTHLKAAAMNWTHT